MLAGFHHSLGAVLRMAAGLWLLWSACASALDPRRGIDQYVQTTWTQADGLPDQAVRVLIQSSDGYLWLGTYGGLARFDGVRFRSYTTSDSGLRSDQVTALAEDAAGVLWIGTRTGGLHWMRDDSGIVPLSSLMPMTISALMATPDGALYVGTREGLYRIREHKVERGWRVAHGLSDDPVTSLWLEPDGSLLVGTNKGLSVLRNDRLDVPLSTAGTERINAIFRRADGSLWLGTDTAIVVLRGDVEIHRFPQAWELSQIYQFLEDRNGGFWVASYGSGLLRYRESGFDIYDPSAGYIDRRSWTMVEDQEGNLWSGTRSGLVRMRDGPVVSWASRQGVADDHVRGVFEDRDGSVWFAHLKGISRYHEGRVDSEASSGLPSGVYRSLLRDRQGRLWAAGESGIQVQTSTGWRRYDRSTGLPSDNVKIVLEAQDGRIYTGHLGGVGYIENDRAQQPAALARLNDASIEALEEDRLGQLWIGTLDHGFWRWRAGQLDQVRLDPATDIGVRSIFEDAEGRLWVGSYDNGLYLLANGEVLNISVRQGLPAVGLWSIVDDGQGRFWFSSDRGVFRIAKQSLLATMRGEQARVEVDVHLGQRDGMKSQEANGGGRPAAIRARDGRLWFATAGGAAVVDPNALTALPPQLDVRIEELIARGQNLPVDSRQALATEERALEWRYTAVYLTDPSALRFRYRLIGQDDQWVEAGERRAAYYTNLAPGTYRFEVEARHARGDYQGATAAVAIHITPFWYERPSVRALGILVLVLGVGSAVGLRLRSQRRLALRLQNEVAQRTSELSEANAELARIAAVDGLTGTATPREFWRCFGEWIVRANAEAPLSLLLVDVDDFKAYNDSYGHVQGDACLRHVADALRGVVSEGRALVARYGGEEFALLLPATDAMQARAIAELARARVEALAIPAGVGARHELVTISVGITTGQDPTATPNQLAVAADAALYVAKNAGRNRVQSAAQRVPTQ